MRLSEEKIKAAIQHSDLDIRQMAIRYFSASYSADPSIMPLVIKAVETFGRQDAYHLIGYSRDLPQTAQTIAWIIDELNNEESNRHENYVFNLSMVLVQADPALLLPRESDILEARHILRFLRTSIVERLQMLSWDEATCWQELEEFCEAGKDEKYVNDVNLGYANQIVEALSRYGNVCEPKVRERLAVTLDDYSHHPMKWLEPLLIRLAGQTNLESVVPQIVAKLHDDADLVSQECAEALTRIGTPAVVHAIAEAFPTAERHFRIYASGVLENIHSDLVVETCLKLFHEEKDKFIRNELANALLSQFAYDTIEPVRQYLIGKKLDFEGKDLQGRLLETCTLMGERFPEYDEWLATEKSEEAEHWKSVQELEDNPEGLIKYALEKLAGKKIEDIPKPQLSLPSASGLAFPHQQASKQKVGRNELCPCGSGKKFKKCCLSRN